MAGRRFGLEEREEIRVGLVRGESLRQIAQRIERPVSTVAREVKRNGGPTRYVAVGAQCRAERRATGLRRCPVAAGGAARAAFVVPETVPGRVAPRWYRRRNRFEEESPR